MATATLPGTIAFLAAFGAMEAAWLTSPVAKRMYASNFRAVQGGARLPVLARPWAALLCYAVLLAAAWLLVVRPVAASRSPFREAFVRAVPFALATYGVYNLTNLATLHGYSPAVAAIDTAWGATVILVPALAAAGAGLWAARAY